LNAVGGESKKCTDKRMSCEYRLHAHTPGLQVSNKPEIADSLY
jgi:hypothetical protein